MNADNISGFKQSTQFVIEPMKIKTHDQTKNLSKVMYRLL